MKKIAIIVALVSVILSSCVQYDKNGYPLSDNGSINKPQPVTINNTALTINGTVNVTNTPLTISGTVNISNNVTVNPHSVNISNNVTLNQPVTVNGSVNVTNIRIDPTTNATVTIDEAHSEIHDGESFFIGNSTQINGGANYTIVFRTPSGLNVHILPRIAAQGETHYYFYESPNVTANGTQIIPVNRNRTSNITAKSTVYYTPTINGYGLILDEQHVGSGKAVGGEQRADNEWILKPDTWYAFVIVNHTVSSEWINLELDWYIE